MNWAPLLKFAFKYGSTLEALVGKSGGVNYAPLIIDVVEANTQLVKKYHPEQGPMLDDFVATLREVFTGVTHD